MNAECIVGLQHMQRNRRRQVKLTNVTTAMHSMYQHRSSVSWSLASRHRPLAGEAPLTRFAEVFANCVKMSISPYATTKCKLKISNEGAPSSILMRRCIRESSLAPLAQAGVTMMPVAACHNRLHAPAAHSRPVIPL